MTQMKGQGLRGVTMGAIIMIFITGLIGVVLLSPLADEIESVTNAGNSTDPVATNVTGASLTLVNLLPLFFALFILVAVFVFAMARRRR